MLKRRKPSHPLNHSRVEHSKVLPSEFTRRTFLNRFATTSTAALLINPVSALAKFSAERHLAFFNTHTTEKLDVVYYSGGNYLPDALAEIDLLFRDHRTEETHPIDPALIDILYRLSSLTQDRCMYQIVSGYRSPATNAMLRKRSNQVAKKSYHMLGKAVDIRLPGVDTKRLRNAAISLQQGGVGYYQASDFVHIDTGRVRTW